jgi:hypothetical protein
MRHEVKLSDLGIRLKKGKNRFTIHTSFQDPYQDLTAIFIPGTQQGLQLQVVEFTVRIR